MNIVVLDGETTNPGDNPWDSVSALGSLTVFPRTTADELVTRAIGAEILVTNKVLLSADVIQHLPNLKFITVLATGFNAVDIEAARHRGIPVSNVPFYSTDAVAQHVFAGLLSFIHRPELHHAAIENGEWERSPDFCFWKSPVYELAGKTMGIIGLGRIGRATAKLANAFGMQVIAHSRTQTEPLPYANFQWQSLIDVFTNADFISLHAPQTTENVGFVNAALLGMMKPTAILINTARGGLINESDLTVALNAGKIGGAILDVVSREPITADNPLLHARNCLLTPHIAWTAIEARRRLMQKTADNIRAFQTGRPINVVNR